MKRVKTLAYQSFVLCNASKSQINSIQLWFSDIRCSLKSERGSAINNDLLFSKNDLLGKNGFCLEESHLKHLNNLIKCILKPILSQFDALSVKNACMDRFSDFQQAQVK